MRGRIAKEKVERLIKITETFNQEISDFISKLDAQRIREFRERFKKILER